MISPAHLFSLPDSHFQRALGSLNQYIPPREGNDPGQLSQGDARTKVLRTYMPGRSGAQGINNRARPAAVSKEPAKEPDKSSSGNLAHVGCSGWNYKHWRGRFYGQTLPQSRWFEHYYHFFNTVEINNSFYQLPSPETFIQWESQAPDDFLYAVKANRYLTHMKKLADCKIPLQRFLGRARLLKKHLGPILYQLPPRWKLNPGRLEDFLKLLPKDIEHVFEFRDATWFAPVIHDLLSKYGASFCCHDISGLLVPRWVTGRTAYVRLHGSDGRYSGGYSRETLREWSDWVKLQLNEGRSAYVYFNNDVDAHAVKDALSLGRMMDAQ